MACTDPIADMIAALKNAYTAKIVKVDMPASKIKEEILKTLKDQGYIESYRFIQDRKQGILRIKLLYSKDGKSFINGIRRISSPGRRRNVGVAKIPRVYRGLGMAILSTSKGILTDKQCRDQGVGGEILCYIW